MRKLKFVTGIQLIVLALGCTAAFASEVYSWVDENGVTNYSERRPPGQEETTPVTTQDTRFGYQPREADTAETATETTTDTAPAGDTVDPDKLIAEEKAKYEAELAEERRYNCNLGKQNLARLETYARMRVRDENGSERFLTPEEMDQKKKESREAIKFHCRG
jgi:hypothetical protein